MSRVGGILVERLVRIGLLAGVGVLLMCCGGSSRLVSRVLGD